MLTFTYNFADMSGVWPIFQFVTANDISHGFFWDSYWYGSGVQNVIDVSGTAITSGNFQKSDTGYEFWYTGTEVPSNLTVEFTVTFNQLGIITAIEMNMVTAE